MRNNIKTSLVLLPGLDGTGILFERLIHELPGQYDPTVCTYAPDQCQSLDELAQTVEQQAAAIHCPVLIAESFGGLVTLKILQRQILTPQAVVFVVSFGDIPCPLLLKCMLNVPANLVPWRHFPLPLLKWFVFGPKGTEHERRLFNRAGAAVEPRVLKHRIQMISSAPLTGLNAQWTLPCADVRARDDRLVRPGCADWFTRRFANLECVQFDGAHYLLQMRTQAFVNWLEGFTARLTPVNDSG